MEEILRKLQKEASGSKHRAIKESCTWAIGKGRRAARGGAADGWRRFVPEGAGTSQQTCSVPLSSSGWEGSGAPEPFKMPGSTALLEGAVAPAAVPESIRVARLPLRLDPPRGSCEADTRISVAVSFRVCFGGAVFSFKGSLAPLNNRRKTVQYSFYAGIC